MIKRLANIVCEEGHLFYASEPEKAAGQPCWYVDAAHRKQRRIAAGEDAAMWTRALEDQAGVGMKWIALTGLICGLLGVLILAGQARAHFKPNTEHNRRHAIVHAFCGSLKPCERGEKALSVGYCESGPKLWPWAKNGQYLGIFQLGVFARGYVASKGVPFAWGPWQQARSAAKLQSDLGWSQWACA